MSSMLSSTTALLSSHFALSQISTRSSTPTRTTSFSNPAKTLRAEEIKTLPCLSRFPESALPTKKRLNNLILCPLLYLQEESIGLIRVELFIRPHNCNQIFCVRKIYYVMCISRYHINHRYLIARNFIVYYLVRTDSA